MKWTTGRAPQSASGASAVVGAGPAGLESAWVAAARGHRVTVFGASERPGGKAFLHAQLPGGENVSSVYDYQEMAAAKAGAVLKLGFRASVEDVLACEADVAVLGGRRDNAVAARLARGMARFCIRHSRSQPGNARTARRRTSTAQRYCGTRITPWARTRQPNCWRSVSPTS